MAKKQTGQYKKTKLCKGLFGYGKYESIGRCWSRGKLESCLVPEVGISIHVFHLVTWCDWVRELDQLRDLKNQSCGLIKCN